MPKSTATVDDGFSKPYKPVGNGGDIGTIDVERSTEPEGGSSKPESIAGFDAISPFDIIDGGTDGGTDRPRKRGRPRGSKNRDGQIKAPSNLIADLEALLLSVHFMGAKILSTPELELSPEEAAKLSDAIKEVAKHYSYSMDPKKLAIMQLCFCAGGIYGSRAIAIIKKPRDGRRGPVLVESKPAQQAPANAAPVEQPAPQRTTGVAPSQLWDEAPIDVFSL